MSQRPDLSVCVCTYNAAERVDRFLPHLVSTLEQSGPLTQLVVVDDGSSDATLDRIRLLAPNAVVIPHDRNRGAAAARNTAARTAEAEWLLFLDDDALVSPEGLRVLWASRQQDQCVVPLVKGPGGELQNSVALRWRFGEPRFDNLAHPIPSVAYPVGTCFLLHRDAYWSVGGFDERFFPNYFEDTAFGFSLKRQGIDVRMLEACEIVHYPHGASVSTDVPDRVQRALFENRWVFCLTTLTGWRRAVVMMLGLPRTGAESIRRRSPGPIHGYLRTCRRMRALTVPWAQAAPVGGGR